MEVNPTKLGGVVMVVSASSSQSGDSTEDWLRKMTSVSQLLAPLERFGAAGVAALAAATPKDSGDTASKWFYEIIEKNGTWSIVWGNSNVVDDRQIAVLLQYGHGTRTGGYVPGRDYINPALRSIFDQAADEGWRVVTAR